MTYAIQDIHFPSQLKAIAQDRRQGASELARQCLRVMADSAQRTPVVQAETSQAVSSLYHLLTEQAEQLAASRPSMTPIQTVLLRWRDMLSRSPTTTLAEARRQAAEAAQSLMQESRGAVQKVADHTQALIQSGQTIVTHSFSSTILTALQSLPAHDIHVIVTESRPLYEGHRVAAHLSERAIPTTLITDAQIGLFVPQADIALLGADSVLADGSVINKAGTYLLALAAHDHQVPVYVCAESVKYRPAHLPEPALEEMDPAELGALSMQALPHVRLRNIYFDRTPARLISGWIDEHGVRLNAG